MSGTVAERKRLIRITAGNLKNNSISIARHYDFFPPDCLGASRKSANGHTKPIEIRLDGLNKTVQTDIGTEAGTGKPRRIFRGRKWVRDFFEHHRIKTGDVLALEKSSAREYRLYPVDTKTYTREAQLPLFNEPPRLRNNEFGAVKFTFADLFAGIGGLRLGLEPLGGRCVFSSEWDKYSQKTYHSWFGELPAGDIRKIRPADIPDHDVMAAGFPCQPFSIAGVSKKKSLGHAHGFKDVTQGTLFFHLATIIEIKRPPVLLLENVKNLKSHDGGRTWKVITLTLDSLGYVIFSQVIDAGRYVPQHRERVFIVGFDRAVFGACPQFSFPAQPIGPTPKFRSILEPKPPVKYTLTDHLWNYLQEYARQHRERGNGFGFGLAELDGVSRTLSARYYKDGSEILIPQPRRNPRRLTPREAARLMGFDPDRYPIVVSDTQAYRQFGNAVVPAVAEAVGRHVLETINEHIAKNGRLMKHAMGRKAARTAS